MLFAWYGHLKTLSYKPVIIAVIISWFIAFFEYLFQVPANRIASSILTLPQMKIIQEALTLSLFIPFSILYMKEPIKLNYLWASMCIALAVFFIFRGK